MRFNPMYIGIWFPYIVLCVSEFFIWVVWVIAQICGSRRVILTLWIPFPWIEQMSWVVDLESQRGGIIVLRTPRYCCWNLLLTGSLRKRKLPHYLSHCPSQVTFPSQSRPLSGTTAARVISIHWVLVLRHAWDEMRSMAIFYCYFQIWAAIKLKEPFIK